MHDAFRPRSILQLVSFGTWTALIICRDAVSREVFKRRMQAKIRMRENGRLRRFAGRFAPAAR
jgi:hypothetical protein